MEDATDACSVDAVHADDTTEVPWELLKLRSGDLSMLCRKMVEQADALRVLVDNGYTDHHESVSDPELLPGDLDAISRWATRFAVEIGWLQGDAFRLASEAYAPRHASMVGATADDQASNAEGEALRMALRAIGGVLATPVIARATAGVHN